MIRLLLDEAIGIEVEELGDADVDAVHVRNLGLRAATDRVVLACAWAEHRILVTANIADPAGLARSGLHRGIVFLEEMMFPPDHQRVHLVAAIDVLRAALAEGQATEQRMLRVWDRSMWEWRGGRPCFVDPCSEASSLELLPACHPSAVATDADRSACAPITTNDIVSSRLDFPSEPEAVPETEPLRNSS